MTNTTPAQTLLATVEVSPYLRNGAKIGHRVAVLVNDTCIGEYKFLDLNDNPSALAGIAFNRCTRCTLDGWFKVKFDGWTGDCDNVEVYHIVTRLGDDELNRIIVEKIAKLV